MFSGNKPQALNFITMQIDNHRPILVVEDDSIDVLILKRGIKEVDLSNPIAIVGNGREALDYLEKQILLPCLILLDINMPMMNGHEFLAEIKGNSRLRRIPVIILTTSKSIDDVNEGYEEGAAGYLVKPVDYAEYVSLLNNIKNYWAMNQLP